MRRSKKKVHSSPQQSDLEVVRTSSAYQGARTFISTPFSIFGTFLLVGGLLSLGFAVVSLTDGGFLLSLFPGLIAVICGLFCFGIASLGSAVFDIADCAIREDARARQREAKDAYVAYQAAQKL
jgi:hypothetical protein